MDIEVEVTAGETYPLPVIAVIADTDIISGPAYLRSFSLRDSLNNLPVQANGQVVAPGAGASIAATGALVGGTYTVSWAVGLQGAAAAADANNFKLVDSNGVVLVSVNPGAAGDYPQINADVTIANGTTVSVQAIGAGTAGVTYSADISATPNGEVETVAEITDGARVVAEVSFRNERTQNVDFGRPGVCIETMLHLHIISGSVTGAFHVAYYKP